ncbi:MAG: PBP1A family penicillin-binding protein [Vicinamibacterales bacterium]|nr:penicillin-binding protein [Acidobacteriota bacterium]MDP6374060.1 PBP1A family penicillin-binding protein [Vicinamibacterales bacterium]MDP6609417.1 PBP1A family penicillin-binding protein [Vicinamibacterales bacterium]HAK56953.1 penicillin-binding protein [Acidobacteriota bacterium]
MARYVIRIARQASLIAAFVGAAIFGIVSGVLFAFAGDLPRITALDDYAPSVITHVHAANGSVVAEFATQRRVVIAYEEIAPHLREAIIASEDGSFNSHFGVSIPRLVITAVRDVLNQELSGASTITMQLARNLFLTLDKTWTRKVQELLLTFQIEKRYTKREILTLYCNQILFGHGAFGVEAAARMYFDKSASDLGLEEAALLAGIIQTPARQSPFVNPDRARSRRSYVLGRMEADGYITAAEAGAARAMPIVVSDRRGESSIAPYFVEEVRQHLESNYGAKQLYEGGLSVHTTLDAGLQRAANVAIRTGLHRLDKRRGYRGAAENVRDAEDGSIEGYEHARWRRPIVEGDRVPAVVTGVTPDRIALRVGRYRGAIGRDGFRWTRREATRLVEPGDVVLAQVSAIDEAALTLTASLDQEPLAEAALIAIENRTGHILAMVGGYDFERSKFNRAVQAQRQLGSLFKPVLYATAIDRGYTPTSIIIDEPVSFPAGPDQPDYEPRNYDQEFEGPVTLRHALEDSRNIPAVQMMAELGPEQVVGYARQMGFTSELPPFLSVALGAAEGTLLEITSAYTVFPNQGVRLDPFQVLTVEDRDGNTLEDNRPIAHESLPADTSFIMTSLLRGVVQRGTARRANALNWPLAGKTGTVDEYTDAWFVGYDPDVTVGVWVGHDQKTTLGPAEEGATAALPIWIEFMQAHIGDRTERPQFLQPANIVFRSVDRRTGDIAEPSAPNAIRESFIAGTEPGIAFQ